ncbi:hypothetical protein FB451DRAFT_1295563 [Mycena latifolia]|nr:hypothetical protein FB451DRAFT_1295563 [Mycena latifolia]
MPCFWQFVASLSPRLSGSPDRRQACSEPRRVVDQLQRSNAVLTAPNIRHGKLPVTSLTTLGIASAVRSPGDDTSHAQILHAILVVHPRIRPFILAFLETAAPQLRSSRAVPRVPRTLLHPRAPRSLPAHPPQPLLLSYASWSTTDSPPLF